MREISGLAKFGYFCVGLFGGLFGVLAAWFMGKDGWGWSCLLYTSRGHRRSCASPAGHDLPPRSKSLERRAVVLVEASLHPRN